MRSGPQTPQRRIRLRICRELTAASVKSTARKLPVTALLFSGLRPIDGPLGAMRNDLVNRVATRLLRTGVPLLNKARSEQGLPPVDDWADQLLGVREISVMTAPQLDFSSRGTLPRNVRYVGPAFEPYTRVWHSPWPETNTDPLVVISLSTSYMNQSALAQCILDAVAGLPVRALLTSGPALETTQLRIPANARTVTYVPHRSVFPHAALVITTPAGRRSTRRSPTAYLSCASPTDATSPTMPPECSPAARAYAPARAPRPPS